MGYEKMMMKKERKRKREINAMLMCTCEKIKEKMD
jgi:hypothetical protein